MTEPYIINFSRHVKSFKLIFNGAVSMKELKNEMPTFIELVGEDGYTYEGNKLMITQKTLDTLKDTVATFKKTRSEERADARAIKKKETNARLNPIHNAK